MQTRRHLVVAAAAATVVIASLAVATDMLGADVSDYATPSETIEATGTEADLGGDERLDQALGQQDGWTAVDIAEPTPDDVVSGPDDAPDQLSVVDEAVERSDVQAEPVIGDTTAVEPGAQPDPDRTDANQPDPDQTGTATASAPGAGESPASTGTTVTPTATVVQPPGNPISDPAVSTTVPLQEAPTGSISPIAAAQDSNTTSTTGATSTSTSTPTSTPTSTTPETSTSTTSPPAVSKATKIISSSTTTTTSTTTTSTTTTTMSATGQETGAAVQPTTTSTTWLPVTTNTPITTWVTTTKPSTTAPVVTVATSGSGSTTSSTTIPSTTRPSTTVPSTTTAAPTTAAPSTGGSGANQGLSAISNTDPRFSRYATVPSASLGLGNLTEPAPVKDNGTVGDGQFRAACQYSHFAYDDPIVYPGQSGRSHLHMFFGNTTTNANSTTDSIVNSGGGTCNGFELNRSAYWTPALLDGRGNAVVPDRIILYYKSKQPGQVQRMPQGLKMVSGNTSAESFTADNFLYWSCGGSGNSYNKSNRIPNCNGDIVNATISFPQCWDGRNMDSADHRSHMALVSPHKPCPSTHPVRLPQISILLYFPGDQGTKGWYLSSDRSGGFNTGPGATLHADWWGGWNDEAMDLWTDGCMKAARNCSFGQTGTDRQLAKLNNFQNYPGPNFLPLP